MRLLKCSLIAIFLPIVLAVVASVAATGLPKAGARNSITLPQSTPIHVLLNTALSSDRSMSGAHFRATISQSVAMDGKTVIPKGAQATGIILDARRAGRLKGRAHLQVALESIQVAGHAYKIRTASEVEINRIHKPRNLARIGAGAGAAVALLTRHENIRLPAETPLTFELSRRVTIPAGS